MTNVFPILLLLVSFAAASDVNDDLVAAATRGDLAKVRVLVAKGADWRERRGARRENAFLAAVNGGHIELVEFFLDKGADANGSDEGAPLLFKAITLGDTALARSLLDHGADANARDATDNPALHLASRLSPAIASLLLDHGARVNARLGDRGRTAIMAAADSGQVESVRLLLAHGADTSLKDRSGMDVVMFAGLQGQEEIVSLIRTYRAEGKVGSAPERPVAVSRPQETPAAREVPEDPKPQYLRPEDPRNYAVVIGAEDYASLPSAQFATRDAQAVRAGLQAMGYPLRNIFFLTGRDATRSKIAQAVNTWLPNRVKADSKVVFYFSGHGAPDVNTKHVYLVGSDGDTEDLESTAYPVKTLYAKLGALKAKKVFIALDSCFSGAGARSVLAKGTRPIVVRKSELQELPDKLVVLTASAGEETSGVNEEKGHGIFTYHLLKGLQGAAMTDGGLTVKSLYDYMSPKVQDDARLQNRSQTPQLILGEGSGEDIKLR